MKHLDSTFKVVVAGSRTFNDFQLLYDKLDILLSRKRSEITIISGGAKGADLLGEAYATSRGHHCIVMEADWKQHGKRAGYIRNEQMADVANAVIVFWDGKSPGTRHMINIAKERQLPLRIVRY